MTASAAVISSASIRRGCVALAAVALAAGCAQEPAASDRAAGTGASWHLTLEQSGGIAGVHKRYTLDSSSDVLVVEDLRRASRIQRPLNGEERRELSKLVAAREGAPAVAPPGRACPDCFGFTITIEGPGKPQSAHYDSRTLTGAPDDALINRILKLSAPAPE